MGRNTRRRFGALLVLSGWLLFTCESYESNETPSGEESRQGATPSTATDRDRTASEGTSAKPTDVPERLPCGEPVVWLAEYSRADFERAYSAKCEESYDGEVEWSLLNPPEEWRFMCTDYEFAVRAIRVYHGHTVDDPDWAEYLKSLSWYRDREKRDLPKAARKNLELLEEKREASCDVDRDVTDADREFFRDFVQTFDKQGEAPTAPLMVDGVQKLEEPMYQKLISDARDSGTLEPNPRFPLGGGKVEPPDGKAKSWVEKHLPNAERVVALDLNDWSRMSCIGAGQRCEGRRATLLLYRNEDDELVGIRYLSFG